MSLLLCARTVAVLHMPCPFKKLRSLDSVSNLLYRANILALNAVGSAQRRMQHNNEEDHGGSCIHHMERIIRERVTLLRSVSTVIIEVG
jgi:hypothetical protein